MNTKALSVKDELASVFSDSIAVQWSIEESKTNPWFNFIMFLTKGELTITTPSAMEYR